jgi:hypothetical protein
MPLDRFAAKFLLHFRCALLLARQHLQFPRAYQINVAILASMFAANKNPPPERGRVSEAE